MCRRAVRLEQGFCQSSVHQKGFKEVLPLLLYPLIDLVVWTPIVTIRIYDVVMSMHKQERNSKLLWLVYSIAVYFGRLSIPLICLIHSSTLCCRKKQTRHHNQTTTTSHIVPNEFTDEENEPLIIRGERTEISSTMYKSTFEETV